MRRCYFAGMRANAANKPDDAIAYAQLNLEFEHAIRTQLLADGEVV